MTTPGPCLNDESEPTGFFFFLSFFLSIELTMQCVTSCSFTFQPVHDSFVKENDKKKKVRKCDFFFSVFLF